MGGSGVGFALLHSLPHLGWSNNHTPPFPAPQPNERSRVQHESEPRLRLDLWALTQNGRQSTEKEEGEDP